MKNHKLSYEFYTKMAQNPDDWISSLRFNLFLLEAQPGVSLREMAEASGANYETFKSFLYGDSKNCKISMIIGICQKYGISMDSLVGAGTFPEREHSFALRFHFLPANVQHFLDWAVSTLWEKYQLAGSSSKLVPLVVPVLSSHGNLSMRTSYDLFDVGSLPDHLRPKVKIALRIPGDSYMPIYSPFDVLLIANDRPAMPYEHTLIISAGFLWIARRVVENGIESFYSIRDGSFRCSRNEIEEVVGYIAAVKTIESID